MMNTPQDYRKLLLTSKINSGEPGKYQRKIRKFPSTKRRRGMTSGHEGGFFRKVTKSSHSSQFKGSPHMQNTVVYIRCLNGLAKLITLSLPPTAGNPNASAMSTC